MDCTVRQKFSGRNLLGQVGGLPLLRIFLTGLNPGLPHYSGFTCSWSHGEAQEYLEQVAICFQRISQQESERSPALWRIVSTELSGKPKIK